MKIVSDLHIHGRYSRATSKALDVANLEKWARVKGVDLLGTGDFTHPAWIEHLKANLKEDPETGARYAGSRFHKSRTFIVERLINRVMVPGHKAKKHKITSSIVTGKASTAMKLVEEAFNIIEKKLKKNPVEVLVGAIVNAAPREEIITIEYGGARYPKAVESAPQRRVDIVLKLMTQGAFQKTHNKKKA